MIYLSFRSGMSSKSDFNGARDARVPIGVVAGNLTTHQLVMSVPRYLDMGGAVFVDSGAFGAFKTGEAMNWADIMERYSMLASSTFKPERLYVVAPDTVGSQLKTMNLLVEWREQIVSLMRAGTNVIVPLQTGSIPGQQMIEKITELLGTNDWVAGIPSNLAAMTVQECATLKHSRFHILGRVQMNGEQESRLKALRRKLDAQQDRNCFQIDE